MKKLGTLICAMMIAVLALTGCVSSECDEPLLDYNQNGKEGDPADYDIMRTAEKQCEEGW